MFVMELTYIAPLEAVEEQLDAHMAWLDAHYASGVFLASGRKVPRDGGIILAAGSAPKRRGGSAVAEADAPGPQERRREPVGGS
ncbi:hypothetical protein EF903_02970 [Streptomyces sp. WAC05292]|uniref:YciI family protein n=1 Tax=Streptomyces sp. WAC05292 TaxID=2487418 RepID=UPI000F73DC98|nr:YciI family protein [Streptomyces sp. WAC05292]RSS96661.1 hypothetical protein EF903_02970 [Streptomyces sp. WAC05292]